MKESGEYQVKVKVQKIAEAGLNATIVDDFPIFEAPDCKDASCCTLNGISSTLGEVVCNIKKNIPEDSEKYLCVYPFNAPDDSKTYFKIATESSQPVDSYTNAQQGEFNFYISANQRDYDRKLTSVSQVEIPADLINLYIQREGCEDDCLLVPLNISAKNNAGLKLSDLNLRYSSSNSVFTESSFRKLEFVPKSASYSDIIRLNLKDLGWVLTPNSVKTGSIDLLNIEK